MAEIDSATNPKSPIVLVVGCGNIGSRLLQSLSNVPLASCGRLDIHGLEKFDAASQTARARFDQANTSGHSLTLHSDISAVPKHIDLLVVSVDARNRLEALSTVLEHASVKYAVLEKTLFLRKSEFEKAKTLLQAGRVKTWVNCSRNVWPGYSWLKSELTVTGPLTEFYVSGSDWNMASNSIHFLAALEYITGKTVSKLELLSENALVRDAKRAGYKEVSGTMVGHLSSGARFELISLPNTGQAVSVKVKTSTHDYAIAEGPQTVQISSEAGTETKAFNMLHASQLETMFELILTQGACGLPPYEQSAQLHMHLFAALEDSLSEVREGELVFPIT